LGFYAEEFALANVTAELVEKLFHIGYKVIATTRERI
jgi:hypothetical protein